ncbi:STAS-like domain-containing protein [Riemerella anatipestifer]|nr:STAS-like domain-containing protein [Riemerella anatipestifer]
MRIFVKDTINTDFAVSTEDGNTIFELLKENFLQDKMVSLDFSGITLMTTAFLNSAIGQLYSTDRFSSSFLKENLKLENVQDHDKPLFALVVKRAKEYFANQNNFEKNSEDSIYGKD